MNSMCATKAEPLAIDPAVESDEKAVMASFLTGKPLDSEVARQVHERAQAIRERVYLKHGIVDIGVPAIRELRGDGTGIF